MNATRNWKAEAVAGACELRPVVRAGAALRIQFQLLLLAASLEAGGAITLRAQVVNDGATRTLANFTTNIAGSVTVGTNGSFTALTLGDNALLTNSAHGFIGRNVTARSNEVRLVSPTSRWRTDGTLLVGSLGERNQLVVSNGGSVIANRGVVGDSSSQNQASVSGPGSIWSNVLSFVAGFAGHSNQVVINSGGVLNNTVGAIGDSGHGNEVAVTGNGSLWESRRDLTIGSVGAGNRLLLSDGGRVVSSNAFIGFEGADNLAVINGAGSVWSNRFELTVGDSGGGNQLAVTNGGWVTSSNGYIGRAVGALGNGALVSGPGSLWTNAADLFLGSPASGGRLEVRAGGTLSTGRGLIGATNSTLNTLVVADSGSRLLAQTELIVGQGGPQNSLVISNGGWAVSSNSYVGYATSAGGNSAFVIGAGSVWSNRNDLTVGSNSPGNRVEVRAGGSVFANNSVRVGRHAQSVSNLVLVTDPGSVWSNAPGSTFELGSAGSSNRLLVSDGGRIQAPSTLIGGTSASEGNEAVLTGAGAVAELDFLVLGNLGPRNRLYVRNGASLLTTGSALGFSDLARGNEAIVADPGSGWAAERLVVGFLGSGSQLVLSNGGTLRSTNAPGTGRYDIRRGTNLLNAGLVEADRLVLTNSQGFFEFNGGTLISGNSVVANGQPFRVGNGLGPATFQLRGNGTHDFALDGLSVSAQGVLAGSGLVAGALVIQPGGFLSPGTPLGRLSLTLAAPPTLLGTTLMEISKAGGTTSNDVIQTASTFVYGGSILVTNRGPDALAPGDRFRLFEAGGFSGSLSNLILPPLGAGLAWRTNLLVDGSIDVVSLAPPGFSSVSLAGTNLVIAGTNGPANGSYTVLSSTNVALPLSDWVSLVTNQFDASGGFIFTNAVGRSVLPGTGDRTNTFIEAEGASQGPSRFYRVKVIP